MPIALAVDLGGTKVEAALVDEDGAVLAGSRHRQPTGPDASSAELAASVDAAASAALTALASGKSLAGVGIGSAGPIDVANGTVSPLNLAAWRGHPLREQLERLVPGTPVRLEMDGVCIALAEHWIGAGQGVDNLMGMVVSTGVGGGLILDGRPFSGPSGNAGHIGHIEVGGFDTPCLCGGIGCLEAVASGPATVRWARSQGWTGSTGEELGASYAAGDTIARDAVRRCGRALGQALAAATAFADLELIAVGGGFSKVTPDLFDIIRETMAERSGWDFVAKVRVVPSALSGDGPLIGAAALIHLG